MTPDSSRTRSWLTVTVLLALTLLAALGLTRRNIAAPETADITLELPAAVGSWTGEDVLYCQNERCLRSFRLHEVETPNTCPVCGSALDRMALGEKNILPPDTLIARKVYQNDRGEQVHATVVLSRSEQRSIHRPQQCLPAQGFDIVSSRIVPVQLAGRAPVSVSILQARRSIRGAGDARLIFAYCFAGGGRETASHYRRLAWMAWDNLVHGYRSRWAYVSVQTVDSGKAGQAETRVKNFIRDFYPLVHRR